MIDLIYDTRDGLYHSGAYAEITGAELVMAMDMTMITPSGDPVNAPVASGEGQNEFTYTTSTPGVLTMNLRARVPSSDLASKVVGDCRFTVDDIPGSVKAWYSSNPSGKPTVDGNELVATVTFTGLPADNSSFGTKTAAIYYKNTKQSESSYEVFFPKDADNHPTCTPCSDCPNWFYYWKEGNVCGIPTTCVFSSAYTNFAAFTIPELDSIIRLCSGAAKEQYSLPYSSGTTIYGDIRVGGNGKGIQCVAELIQHEQEHINIYQQFKHLFDSTNDWDDDWIPNIHEATYRGIATDPNKQNTFRIPNYSTSGDREVRCDRMEEILTIPIFSNLDWANPGCQNFNQYGPIP